MTKPRRSLLFALLAAGFATAAQAAPPTLILHHADIWTVDPAHPRAEAIAVEGERIVKVGSEREVMALQGPATRVIDLKGAFVLPGLIDAHTHFGNAVESFFQVRLVDVDAEPLLLARLKAAAHEVPKGLWITGYDWDAKAAAAAKKRGDKGFAPFTPTLAEVDAAAPDHPVLLRRYDGAYFVNSRGLALARIDKTTPDPANGEYVKDPRTGELTGLLLGSAGERMALMLPPPSRARDLIGARAMLRLLNSYGITGIQDISRVDEISQTKLFETAVERSFTNLDLFKDLKARGELTVRVYPILSLVEWRELKAAGITPGSGDDMIRYGALKVFVDATLMEKPFDNTPGYAGALSYRVVSEAANAADITGADALGFDIAAHVLGDKAHRLLAGWYEAAAARNGPRDRRDRFIHGWYPAPREVERMGAMHAIVDVTPSQLIEELPVIRAQLGARADFAFPWRSMIEHGVRLDIGSDWPGSFDRNSVFPVDPFENIYYAVTRRPLGAPPAAAFHPEQALTVDEAIAAYTMGPAYASREEAVKGSITPGKLADFAVLDRDIRKIPPAEIPHTRVILTILGGRVVYDAESTH
jgi:predicted amidohydrolase YtcJ